LLPSLLSELLPNGFMLPSMEPNPELDSLEVFGWDFDPPRLPPDLRPELFFAEDFFAADLLAPPRLALRPPFFAPERAAALRPPLRPADFFFADDFRPPLLLLFRLLAFAMMVLLLALAIGAACPLRRTFRPSKRSAPNLLSDHRRRTTPRRH